MEADASVFYQHQNKILGGENTTKGVKILSNGESTTNWTMQIYGIAQSVYCKNATFCLNTSRESAELHFCNPQS